MEANFFLSKKTKDKNFERAIKELSKEEFSGSVSEETKKNYYTNFWLKNKCNIIRSYSLAKKIFELSMMLGVSKAQYILKNALVCLNKEIKEEGVVGPQTADALMKTDQFCLFYVLKSEAACYLKLLIKEDKSNAEKLKDLIKKVYK
jgi:lysozyme family protein